MAKALRTNAESWQQLLVELKDLEPRLKDVYYSEHEGSWFVQFNDDSGDEFDSLIEALSFIGVVII